MGVIHHHAVLATTWDDNRVRDVRVWISTLPQEQQSLFTMGAATRNDYITIVLIPDGSKEGWQLSDEIDKLRDQFIQRLDEYWQWVEVAYGECGQQVTRGNNVNRYA